MKILCIPYSHTLSHISRPLAVAIELRRRGHEIVFAGEGPRKSFIEHEGFPVIPLFEPDPDVLYGNIRSGKLKFVSDSDIEKMIAADLALYKEVSPDIVLTDGRFTAPISCHVATIKHAAIVNVSSTEYRAFPYVPFFQWIPEIFVSREGAVQKVLDRFNLAMEMFVFDRAMSSFSKLSKQYKFPKKITATNCLVGKDLTLLPDIPEYFPTRNLPQDYHYIGPITFRQELPKPDWWPANVGTKPLIYITMGTTGISNFFEIVHDVISSSDVAAIVTTGGHGINLVTKEGTIYVDNFLDGDMVIETCDLIVCHGGNGTIYQALSHGKPVIGIPTIPDQAFNMRRVEALGCGKTITWQTFSKNPRILLKVIHEIINSVSFSNRARRLQKIISTYDAPKTAADHIEGLINDRF
jgi:UDP:flavonoid glycosyltransferase YjiC (YdhE family)